MHLVFLNQYYPPDAAPTGVMLEGLVEGLLRDGHQVSVLCAAGGYAGKTRDKKTQDARQDKDPNIERRTSNIEHRTQDDCGREQKHSAQAPPPTRLNSPLTIDNSSSSLASCVLHSCVSSTIPEPQLRIIRIGASKFGRGTFAGKLADYASYYVGVGWKLLTLRPRPDRIVALTTPPYLSLLARLMSKWRGADHAHWVMDVYPDVLAAHGMLRERSLAYRLLAALACWGMGGKRCAAILTLGPDMAERVGCQMGCTGYQLSEKTQDEKTQDARQEENEEEEANIEHRTSNIERRMQEDRGRELEHDTQSPPTTRPNTPRTNGNSPSSHASCVLQSCVSPSIVSWVPLWGTGVADKTQDEKTQDPRQENANIEHPTSNFKLRTEEDCGNEPRRDTQAPQTTRLNPQGTIDNAPSSLASCAFGELSRAVLQSSVSSSTDPRSPTPLPQHQALRRSRGWEDAELVVMYSGNMGLGHRFGEILAAAGSAGVVGSSLSDETQDKKTQDARQENANIEDSISNFELRTEEDCGNEPGHFAQSPPTTRPNSPRTISNSSSSLASCVLPSCVSSSMDTRSPATLPPLRFVFFGGGKRRDEVAKYADAHPEAGIELHDYAPAHQLLAHLQSADVHLASLEPAWSGTMVPSKLQGIFAAARPVIFIGSAESSIGRWVMESGGGWVVAAGDVGGLLAALEQARDPGERAKRGRAAMVFAEEHFDQRRNVARVAAILTAR